MKRIIPLLALLLTTATLVRCGSDDSTSTGGGTTVNTAAANVKVCVITSPANNALVPMFDTIDLAVMSAYDNDSIVAVEYFMDGESLGTFTETGTTSNWFADSTSGGLHQLRAVATYTSGTTGSQRLNITVVAPAPAQQFSYNVLNTYPHDPTSYTQGLVVQDGFFYESTGLNGQSKLRKVDIQTGKVLQNTAIGQQFFGEGISVINNRIFMLTWNTQVGFIFDKFGLTEIDQFSYSGEGWGLTYNGEHLIMSDGTANLRFLDPKTLQVVRELTVVSDANVQTQLNELEFINGEIWANVYQTNKVVVIDPNYGYITKEIDFSGLLSPVQRQKTDVFNGIAYDESNGHLYVTGKLWPSVFQVETVAR